MQSPARQKGHPQCSSSAGVMKTGKGFYGFGTVCQTCGISGHNTMPISNNKIAINGLPHVISGTVGGNVLGSYGCIHIGDLQGSYGGYDHRWSAYMLKIMKGVSSMTAILGSFSNLPQKALRKQKSMFDWNNFLKYLLIILSAKRSSSR
jgi:hypothetical protein